MHVEMLTYMYVGEMGRTYKSACVSEDFEKSAVAEHAWLN